jgi:O-antigen/teichoic acid export membrane protein
LEKQNNSEIAYSGTSIAKNTLYNLLGYGIPLIFAVILIPPLVRGLGDERFGILNLAWIIIGYFSLFDLGIGRGLTKITAEKIGLNQKEVIPRLFWTSLLLMLSFSFFIAIILIFLIPYLVNNVFSISENIQSETIETFYALALAIPIVSTTAGLRGVLEAYQKFKIISIIRVLLGTLTFLGPLVFLILTNSLFWIVVFLIIIRIMIWVLYLFQCFKVNPGIKKEIKFDFVFIKPVLKFSIWITIANIVGPIILYSDRFLIGALISAAAITYYATPYEVITKLLLISGALSGVLFPIFSSSFYHDINISKKIFLRGVKFIFLILFPLVFLISMFSHEFMQLWLGKKFALSSSLVLQFLSVGIFMNGISSIPDNFFQGIGKPRIPAIIMLIELPVYIFIMWYSIELGGINGAAITYMCAATINAIVMYCVAYDLFHYKFDSDFNILTILITIITLIIPFIISAIYLKIIVAIIFLLIFNFISWKYFLSVEEKIFIISKIKVKFN